MAIKSKLNGRESKRVRAQLLERDGPNCCFCGIETIDYNKADGNLPDDAITIEHLLDRSKGGTHKLENLRISCHKCNNFRSRYRYTIFSKLSEEEFNEVLRRMRTTNEKTSTDR